MTRRKARRTKPDVLRAVIYVRISKDRVGGKVTVQRQEKLCRKLAESLSERLGVRVEVVEVYCDNDISASGYTRKIRKDWNAMCVRLRADRDVDLVLSYHTDRLYRSMRELTKYIDLSIERDITTHCVESGLIDLSTATGRLNARIGAAIAEYEVDRMSERIRAERAEALEQGKWTGGNVPFGYDRKVETDPNTGDVIRAYLVVNEEQAQLIRVAAEDVMAGVPTSEIQRDWAAAGYGRARGAVNKALMNARVAGLVSHHGEVLDGVTAEWPAILGMEDYLTVCAILDDPGRTTHHGNTSLTWVGSRLYRCGKCEGVMRSSGNAGGDGHVKRRIYRCNDHGHLTVPAEWVDDLVIESACYVLDRYGAALIDRPKATGEGLAGHHRKLNTLTSRLGALEDRWTSGDDDLSEMGYWRMRKQLTDNIAEVSSRLDSAGGRTALSGVADAPRPSDAFRALPVARRRAVLDELFTVTIKPGRAGRLPAGMLYDRDRLVIKPKRKGVELSEVSAVA